MLSLRREKVKKKIAKPVVQESKSTLEGADIQNQPDMQTNFVRSWPRTIAVFKCIELTSPRCSKECERLFSTMPQVSVMNHRSCHYHFSLLHELRLAVFRRAGLPSPRCSYECDCIFGVMPRCWNCSHELTKGLVLLKPLLRLNQLLVPTISADTLAVEQCDAVLHAQLPDNYPTSNTFAMDFWAGSCVGSCCLIKGYDFLI